MAADIYRQQKVLSHFPVCCWIDWLLMIKNCLIESGPPCIYIKELEITDRAHNVNNLVEEITATEVKPHTSGETLLPQFVQQLED
jgi:hypothetical protein